MLPLPAAGGWVVGQDALASPGACPICLDAFSVAGGGGGEVVDGPDGGGGANGGGVGGGLIGADGLPATTSDCGHTFCQR